MYYNYALLTLSFSQLASFRDMRGLDTVYIPLNTTPLFRAYS